MKKIKVDEDNVVTRPSTTLIQSKFVVTQVRLFQLGKRALEGKWLKPQSEAMYTHIFHQILKQQKCTSSQRSAAKAELPNKLFIKYFDMANIIKQFKFCITNRLSNDRLKPTLNRKITQHLQKIGSVRAETHLCAKFNILQLKQQDPMKKNNLHKSSSNSKYRLRFNQQENRGFFQNRNVLGIIQKKSPHRQQDYGLQSGVNKSKPLLKHKKCLSNFNNYQDLDFYQKELAVKLPKNPKQSSYYQMGLGSQHLTKNTSPQKSLKSSRKGSLKRPSLLKKKIVSQKTFLKSQSKTIKK